MTELKAIIDRGKNILSLEPNIQIQLKNRPSIETNHVELKIKNIAEELNFILNQIIDRYDILFGPLSVSDELKTSVRAEINTKSDDPTYTKSYPYPAAIRREVDRQIEELLSEGVICSSRSPYHSPVWLGPKKQNQMVKNSIDWL